MPLGHNLFLFKMCFMRQTNFSDEENVWKAVFADHSNRTSGFVFHGRHGTGFVVKPVYGCEVSRPNAILGVVYHHLNTDKHCELMTRGVDPSHVKEDSSVSIDLVVATSTATAKGNANAKAKGKANVKAKSNGKIR